MKKSLKQLLALSLSASVLVSAAPVAFAESASADVESAQEEAASETADASVASEQAESVASDAESVEADADSAAEDAEKAEAEAEAEAKVAQEAATLEEAEVSAAQAGVDAAVKQIKADYPEAAFDKIDVVYDREEDLYEITVEAFTAEENVTYEVVWQNGSAVESGYDQNLFNTGGGEAQDAEEAASEEEEAVSAESVAESTEEAAETDASVTEADVAEAEADAAAADAVADSDERPALDLDKLVSLDEATATALETAPESQAIRWTLVADATDFWDNFQAEENVERGPVWTVELGGEADTDPTAEVNINAVTGEVIESESEQAKESAESIAEKSAEEEAASN